MTPTEQALQLLENERSLLNTQMDALSGQRERLKVQIGELSQEHGRVHRAIQALKGEVL